MALNFRKFRQYGQNWSLRPHPTGVPLPWTSLSITAGVYLQQMNTGHVPFGGRNNDRRLTAHAA